MSFANSAFDFLQICEYPQAQSLPRVRRAPSWLRRRAGHPGWTAQVVESQRAEGLGHTAWRLEGDRSKVGPLSKDSRVLVSKLVTGVLTGQQVKLRTTGHTGGWTGWWLTMGFRLRLVVGVLGADAGANRTLAGTADTGTGSRRGTDSGITRQGSRKGDWLLKGWKEQDQTGPLSTTTTNNLYTQL